MNTTHLVWSFAMSCLILKKPCVFWFLYFFINTTEGWPINISSSKEVVTLCQLIDLLPEQRFILTEHCMNSPVPNSQDSYDTH